MKQILPQAKGEAKIEASFDILSPAAQLGSAYLTYVLWAISLEGRANNLGQLILDWKKRGSPLAFRLLASSSQPNLSLP